VDPDGRIPAPVVAALIGAAIGAGVSATAAIIDGKSGTEVFAAAVGGAVDGLAVSSTVLLKSVSLPFQAFGSAAISAFCGGAGEYVEQYLNGAFGNQEEISISDVFLTAGISAVTSGGSEFLENSLKSGADKMIKSEVTANLLEKDIKKGAKSTGKKLKPSAVDNLVEAEQKEMSNAASKIIDVSFKSFGYSYNFYSDIYEDTK
jgi:hypothetical protein